MRSTGIVRKMDELGRVVIPKETRSMLGVEEKDALEIYHDEATIYLKKYAPGCLFCNNVNKLINFKGTRICNECQEELVSCRE